MRFLMALLAVAPAVASGAQLAANVALVTEVSGDVRYRLSEKGPALAVRPFMKARVGDRFDLKPSAHIRIVYYRTGHQESWSGPAEFAIGQAKSEAIGAAAPKVAALPAGAARSLTRVPALLKRAGSTRLGAAKVRSAGTGGEPWQKLEDLTPEARRDYDSARKLYADLVKGRSDARADDPTPELILIGALGRLRLQVELTAEVASARKRFPRVATFAKLDLWLNPPPPADTPAPSP